MFLAGAKLNNWQEKQCCNWWHKVKVCWRNIGMPWILADLFQMFSLTQAWIIYCKKTLWECTVLIWQFDRFLLTYLVDAPVFSSTSRSVPNSIYRVIDCLTFWWTITFEPFISSTWASNFELRTSRFEIRWKKKLECSNHN